MDLMKEDEWDWTHCSHDELVRAISSFREGYREKDEKLRAALAAKEKAEGALRSVAGAVGEFADADGKNIVEKIEFLRKDWEERDEVWREKKRVLENDLGKAWEENKLLREELRTGLAMTACPACGSETANTNESRLNLENKRLREVYRTGLILRECDKCGEWHDNWRHFIDVLDMAKAEYSQEEELRRAAAGREG